MHLFVEHTTEYHFSEPQARLVQLLRLTPECFAGQNIIDWRIDVDCDARLKPGRDGFGNTITMLYIEGPIESVSLGVYGEILTEDRSGILDPSLETLPPETFLQETKLTRADKKVARLIKADRPLLDWLHELNLTIHGTIELDAELAPVGLDAATILEQAHGRPVDFAHLFIASARANRIPARIVSGYHHDISTHPSPHAWVEAWVDGLGWVGFDPVLGRCPDESYIRIATGLDYLGAAPLSGARMGGGGETLKMAVRVSLTQRQRQQ
jgi:transglutaminase-like putative cysteine protease